MRSISLKHLSKEELLQWQYDKDFQLDQVSHNCDLIKYIHYPDKEIQLCAVKQDITVIRYIDRPHKEVQLYVVRENGDLLKYIHDPVEKVCRDAVYQRPLAITYVNIEKYPEVYNLYVFLCK